MIPIIRLVALAALGFAVQAPASAQSLALDGLWVSSTHWDAGPSGTLAIERHGKTFKAKIGDESTSFTTQGTVIQFAFPDGHGEFRGRRAGTAIRGFWIQPHAGNGDPRDPDGKGQTFTSPVVLTRGKNRAWRGTVLPLIDTFTLYLDIFRDDKGTLIGAFRNPEMNFRARASQFSIVQSGNALSFTATDQGSNQFSGAYAATPQHIDVRFGGIDRTFTFTRATPEQSAGFYPRPKNAALYMYRAPADIGDGWHVARASNTGMDDKKLAAVVQSIIDTDPFAKRPSLIHSLLIAHHGKLVLEEYFSGFDSNTPHDMRSAAKTFSSVILGAEMLRGAAISPDTRIYLSLAKMAPFASPDPRKNQITLAQLLTHTSGLACDDNDENSPGGEDVTQSQRAQPDWWKFTLDLPMSHDPGTRYAYCSPGTNLVGAALVTTSHKWLPQLFDETVARPLQWSRYYWDLMPNDEGYLGGGVFVRPRDMLKLGQAYLDGGVWNGKRIVSAAWVEESTASHVVVSPETTGLSPDDFRSFYFPGEDGYAWHRTTLHTPTRNYRAYGASGNGGQLLVVVPELDLVVGFTGGNYGQGLIWNAWRDKLIPNTILPTIFSAQ
jgi:CubicO group peptidase (beta-lactamase class C family)